MPLCKLTPEFMMSQYMERIKLKGGSLSGTYLYKPQGAKPFVRKEASLSEHREYGFQRWYSQLKRLQRYSVLFPGIFPKLITYGKSGDLAYFDLEFVEEAVTIHEFLTVTTDKTLIDALFTELVAVMSTMHCKEIPSTAAPFDLYIYEEIEQKMIACGNNKRFQEFVNYTEIVFNGEKVPGLRWVLEDFREIGKAVYRNTTETFTHGNLTLENILYQSKTGKVIFIDPYEENIIDSKLAEYSQILQSSNSKYEIYNGLKPTVFKNSIQLKAPEFDGLNYFNTKFLEYLRVNNTAEDIFVIRLFEVSQYARMLPFKMEIDEEKMLFFYGLGSYLFHKLMEDWKLLK